MSTPADLSTDPFYPTVLERAVSTLVVSLTRIVTERLYTERDFDVGDTPMSNLPRIQQYALLTAAFVLGAGGAAAFVARDAWLPATANAAPMPGVREFHLAIEATDIPMGGDAVWHAWTFNGTVPGPTLTATVGDIIQVTVHNKLNLTHSFHSHLSPYQIESDGSQINAITGIGGMAMIPPGESYTYSFRALEPGLFYYHCHSADGGKSISAHMAQGLYGAIIIKAVEEAPVRDEVIFMAERGFNVEGKAPYFIMNGKGIPGGEATLEKLHHEGGVGAVAAQFGVTVPIIKAKVGEPVRLSIVNIGDMIHSFHMHGMTAYMVDHDRGTALPAQVLGLVPGEADRLIITPAQPGIWLFHCHVGSHADAGMIGVLVVEA